MADRRWHNLPRAVAVLEKLFYGKPHLTRSQERRAYQFLTWGALLTERRKLAAVCVRKAFGLTEPLPPDAHLFAVDWAWLDQPDQFQQWLREQREPRGRGEITGRVLFDGKPATGITVLVAPMPPKAKGDRETVRIQRYNAACRLNVTGVPDWEPGAVHGGPRDENDPDPAAHRGGASAVTAADGSYILRHLAPGRYAFMVLINLGPDCPDGYEVDPTEVFTQTMPIAVASAQSVKLPDLEIQGRYPFTITHPTDYQVLTTTKPTFRWTAPEWPRGSRYQVVVAEMPAAPSVWDEEGTEVRGQSWTYKPAPPQRPFLRVGRNYRVSIRAVDAQGRRYGRESASFSLAPADQAAAVQSDNDAVRPFLVPDLPEDQKPAEWIRAAQAALTNHPHTTYRGLLHDILGHLYWKTGDLTQARQEFEKVQQECPDWTIGRCAAAALADSQAGRAPRGFWMYVDQLDEKGGNEP
jgi:hypothetical protein